MEAEDMEKSRRGGRRDRERKDGDTFGPLVDNRTESKSQETEKPEEEEKLQQQLVGTCG